MLSREEILKKTARASLVVPCEGFGDVLIFALTMDQRSQIEDIFRGMLNRAADDLRARDLSVPGGSVAAGMVPSESRRMNERVFAWSVCDTSGVPMFSEEEVREMSATEVRVIDFIATAALAFNGFATSKDAVEESAKN